VLVYCNHVPLHASAALPDILEPVAQWLSRKLKRKITAEALSRGGDIYRKDGWSVRSHIAVDAFPHLLSIELVHPDSAVKGRRWHTEIGLQHRTADADVEVTVLVQTSEISARVTDPVQPGAPTIVTEILRQCQVSSVAVGGALKELSDNDAEGFRHVVLDPQRDVPLVVVSPTKDGKYLVDVSSLSQLLIGIADVIVIPTSTDTFWLARSIGRDFVPYLGAVKIIFPSGTIGRPTVRTLTATDFAECGLDIRSGTKEVFSLVLHRTNLPLSWNHVGPERVRKESLRRELERRREAAAASGDCVAFTQFLETYIAEQEKAAAALTSKNIELSDALEGAKRLAEENERKLAAKNAALKFQLERAGAVVAESPYAPEDIDIVADTIATVIKRAPTPEECLRLIEHLYPSRVLILPDAWLSARESAEFDDGQKLFGLLRSLVTDYWSSLNAGRPDQEARKVFGSAYAAKESETVASKKEAKRKRTFRFGGEDHVMEKHLKIGRKDSAVETIRVHFDWLADRRLILLRHCGPHIPFK
jgi:hypothetical protein